MKKEKVFSYEMLERATRGSKEAKAEIIECFYPLIISSIKKYNNRIYLVDDLIQDGNEVILKAISEYDPEKGVEFPWFLKTKLKYFYMNAERKDRDNKLSLDVETEEGTTMGELIPFSQTTIEEDYEKKVVLECLTSEIQKLSEIDRKIIVMYYFKKKKILQIAETLGLKAQSVKNRKKKVLEKLKKVML